MEKADRIKYYPISLKDKELHDKFVIEQKMKKFKNADQMVEYLLELEEENKFLEKRCTKKENDFNELLDKQSENLLTQDEIKALYQKTSDVDMYETGNEEFTGNIRSANNKLYRMIKES